MTEGRISAAKNTLEYNIGSSTIKARSPNQNLRTRAVRRLIMPVGCLPLIS